MFLLVPAVAAVFWILAIADVIAVDGDDVVRMPKEGWLLFVLAVPVVGALFWIRRGRATHVSFPATLLAHGMPHR